MKFIKYFAILSILLTPLINSCGSQKDNSLPNSSDSDNQKTPDPTLSLTVTAPPELLYIQSNPDTSAIGVYTTSSTDGFIVGSTTDSSSLTPYTGIPVSTQSTGLFDQALDITVSSSGDENCNNLFSYDTSKSQVIIGDVSNIRQLTLCNLEITAKGNLIGNTIKDVKNIQVALNPTFELYGERGNPLVNLYIKNQFKNDTTINSTSNNISLLTTELKKMNAFSVAITNFSIALNPTENQNKSFTINNINALAGNKNITYLDLSHSSLSDYRALLFLPNLKNLNLSNSNINEQDLAKLGQKLKNITSLSIQNIDLQDLTVITKNFINLQELDISNNLNLGDLSKLNQLKKLINLRASNMGLNNLKWLDSIPQIENLDVSNNDFSHISDSKYLVNLIELKSLNVSMAKVPNFVLNSFFSQIPNRTNFVDFEDSTLNSNPKSANSCNYVLSNDVINSIGQLIRLTNLNLHGNSCTNSDKSISGLTNTTFLTNLKNLKTLDISDTLINNLSGINALPQLEKLILENIFDTFKIDMPKEVCQSYLNSTKFSAACNNFTPTPPPPPPVPSWETCSKNNMLYNTDTKSCYTFSLPPDFKIDFGFTFDPSLITGRITG